MRAFLFMPEWWHPMPRCKARINQLCLREGKSLNYSSNLGLECVKQSLPDIEQWFRKTGVYAKTGVLA